jgi:cytochrome c oxidase cbb3-type subunit III
MKRLTTLAIVLCFCAFNGCKREHRVFDPGSSGAQIANGVALNEVRPGGPVSVPDRGPYEESAYAVGEGKRLYSSFNCVGCHNHGGGGIGPALMDAKWIYGSHPEQIYSTIVQGRPNGMPSFGGKIPDYQVWELVAYVRSMSGQLPTDVAPGRSDEIQVKKAEQAKKKEHPPDENPQKIEKGQP